MKHNKGNIKDSKYVASGTTEAAKYAVASHIHEVNTIYVVLGKGMNKEYLNYIHSIAEKQDKTVISFASSNKINYIAQKIKEDGGNFILLVDPDRHQTIIATLRDAYGISNLKEISSKISSKHVKDRPIATRIGFTYGEEFADVAWDHSIDSIKELKNPQSKKENSVLNKGYFADSSDPESVDLPHNRTHVNYANLSTISHEYKAEELKKSNKFREQGKKQEEQQIKKQEEEQAIRKKYLCYILLAYHQ